MASKQSARRRVSTTTTAPIAPRHNSLHMNWKRGCPGAPNRYSIRSSPRVMRPKSNATVVVVFAVPSRVRSISAVTSVNAASVVSGTISEIDPTNVVFPTPKPPATTILTGNGDGASAGDAAAEADPVPRPGNVSKGLKTIEHPFEQSHRRATVAVVVAVDFDEPVG